MGRVIVLSGTPAAGKTTTATQVQVRLPEPYLHLPLDAFISMLGPKFTDAAFHRMELGYHHAVAATARAGNNVVTDHFRPELDLELYAGLDVLLVGVHCPLDGLLRRATQRPEHLRGLAAANFPTAHTGRSYDVEVDTSRMTPQECAERILAAYRRPWAAFDRMREAAGS